MTWRTSEHKVDRHSYVFICVSACVRVCVVASGVLLFHNLLEHGAKATAATVDRDVRSKMSMTQCNQKWHNESCKCNHDPRSHDNAGWTLVCDKRRNQSRATRHCTIRQGLHSWTTIDKNMMLTFYLIFGLLRHRTTLSYCRTWFIACTTQRCLVPGLVVVSTY